MRLMAGPAFPGFNRQMLDRGLLQKIVMAVKANLQTGFEQHFGIGRTMGMMTGRAFIIFDGHVFEQSLSVHQEIVVTGEADLGLWPFHGYGNLGLMTDIALSLCERRVPSKLDGARPLGLEFSQVC